MGNLCCLTSKPADPPKSWDELLVEFIRARCEDIIQNRKAIVRNPFEVHFNISWNTYQTSVHILLDGVIFTTYSQCLFCDCGQCPKSWEMPYKKFREILLQLDNQIIVDKWYLTINKKHSNSLDSDLPWTDGTFTDINRSYYKYSYGDSTTFVETVIPGNTCKLKYYPTKKDQVVAMQKALDDEKKTLEQQHKILQGKLEANSVAMEKLVVELSTSS